MTNSVKPIGDATFEQEVLHNPLPVLVDFWADWCGPCKTVAPVIEELAREYGSRLKVVKLNVDDNPLTPARYGIRGIPTLMLFKRGEVAGTQVGALPKSRLSAFVQAHC